MKTKKNGFYVVYAYFLPSQMDNIFVGVIAPRAMADNTIVDDARIISAGEGNASANANKAKPAAKTITGYSDLILTAPRLHLRTMKTTITSGET